MKYLLVCIITMTLCVTAQAEDVKIKTFTDEIVVEISLDKTVEDLKKIILEKKGYPIEQQELKLFGKEIEDKRTLQSYDITKNSTLRLVIRLRGK